MMRLIAPSASLALTLCNGARLIREKKTQMEQNRSWFRKEKTVRLPSVERTTSMIHHTLFVFSRCETFDTEARVSYALSPFSNRWYTNHSVPPPHHLDVPSLPPPLCCCPLRLVYVENIS